jgi:hypothetical protein
VPPERNGAVRETIRKHATEGLSVRDLGRLAGVSHEQARLVLLELGLTDARRVAYRTLVAQRHQEARPRALGRAACAACGRLLSRAPRPDGAPSFCRARASCRAARMRWYLHTHEAARAKERARTAARNQTDAGRESRRRHYAKKRALGLKTNEPLRARFPELVGKALPEGPPGAS